VTFLGLGIAACSSTPARPKTPDGLSCGQRLVGGSWRFAGFTPDRPLPQASAANLEKLHGSLRLGFDGQKALTTGPGLYHLGPYQVADDDGMSCRIVAPDDGGVVTETNVRFLDANHLEVVDRRSAVPGRATLERVPGPPLMRAGGEGGAGDGDHRGDEGAGLVDETVGERRVLHADDTRPLAGRGRHEGGEDAASIEIEREGAEGDAGLDRLQQHDERTSGAKESTRVVPPDIDARSGEWAAPGIGRRHDPHVAIEEAELEGSKEHAGRHADAASPGWTFPASLLALP
jgi:hypothetical protein